MRFMWGFKYFDADLVEETDETFTLQMQSPAANLFTKQVKIWEQIEKDPMLKKEYLYGHKESIFEKEGKMRTFYGHPMKKEKIGRGLYKIIFSR